MRLFSAALLTALFVPLAAFAQSTKQVEVINLPAVQDVTGTVEVTNDAANPVEIAGEVAVTNLPTPTVAARYQLVGFTTATFLGSEGSLGFTRACDAEFSNSRWCTSAEVLDSVNLPALSGDAWVRAALIGATASYPVDVTGLATSGTDFNCDAWRAPPTGEGFTVSASGKFEIMPCFVPRSVACCALVP
jgi:hypothetical protein